MSDKRTKEEEMIEHSPESYNRFYGGFHGMVHRYGDTRLQGYEDTYKVIGAQGCQGGWVHGTHARVETPETHL